MSVLGIPNSNQTKEVSVFAHWIVPMKYEASESGPQRNIDDVRAAMEEGLNGFALDAFSGAQAEKMIEPFISAANSAGAGKFEFFLSADMAHDFKAQEIVDIVSRYGNNPHYLKINGKPVLSTYRGGEKGDGWWQDNVIGPLNAAGHPVTFLPFFDRSSPNGDDPSVDKWNKTLHSFQVDGLFNFGLPASPPFYTSDPNLGHHKWSGLEGEENLASALHNNHQIFISTYAPYFWAVCHPARQYIESQAGRGMDNVWTSIVSKQRADGVEIVTWNDYSESTYIQPTQIPLTKFPGITSYAHTGYYELLKYYIRWYRTGVRPTISRDAVFYFYRPNIRGATFTDTDAFCPLGRTKADQIWGNFKPVIFITAALTEPAELHVGTGATSKRYQLSAGLTSIDVPFATGPQTVEVWRNGRKVTGGSGPDISEDTQGDNFNLYSGYAISGGKSSETWHPSDAWKTGFIADWFRDGN